jgi:hypothetical protein
MIDLFLAELRPLLPLFARSRALAEVEAHLRASATEHGEEEALRRFGAATDVARGLAAVYAPHALRIAGAAALALAAAPVVGYGIVENALPPAPWASGAMPAHLEWKVHVAMLLYGLALVALGVAAVSFAVWRALAASALGGAVVAVGAMGIVGGILNLQWADAVPGTPGWLPLVGILQAVAAVVALAPAVEAGRLVRASGSYV